MLEILTTITAMVVLSPFCPFFTSFYRCHTCSHSTYWAKDISCDIGRTASKNSTCSFGCIFNITSNT